MSKEQLTCDLGASVKKERAYHEQTAWEIATAGTYCDHTLSRAFMICFLAAALVLVAVPALGMLWARTDSTTENRELANPPELITAEGGLNWRVLEDAGTYFEDHFAYRNELVSLNARLRSALLSSPTDQVVVGTDGWLYYGGTLPDYLGQGEMSERALRNAAHNLQIVQGYVESWGGSFVFTLAPDKNALYPGHMPYYYLRCETPGNAQRLKAYLEDYGVNYVDLFDLFANEGQQRYLTRDTHWDNRGALKATQALLAAAEHDLVPLDESNAEARNDFSSDLEAMLYPSWPREEQNWYFDGYDDLEGLTGALWSFEEGSSVTDASIATLSDEGSGSLYFYRDSFGNALVGLWAPAFEHARFSKLVPYDIMAAAREKSDVVVLERAERHLDYLTTTAPYMPSPRKAIDAPLPEGDDADGDAATLAMEENGPYVVLSGQVDESVIGDRDDIRVLVSTSDGTSMLYEPFWTSGESDDGADANDFGFQVNVSANAVDFEGASVFVCIAQGDALNCVKTFKDVSVKAA